MTLSKRAARLLQASAAPKEKTREALVMSIQAAEGDLEQVARDFGMKRGPLDRWIHSEELRDWHRACWPPPIPAGFVCFYCKRRKPPNATPPCGGHCLCGESTYWVDSTVAFGVPAPVPTTPAAASRPGGFDALARLLLQAAPVALNFDERYELRTLQEVFTTRARETYATPRAELEALRALLRHELQEVRALTQDTPTPAHYPADPAMELVWRRPLAAAKVKADAAKVKAAEEAREETARLKRQADEQRNTSKKELEARQAEETARLKRQADEQRKLKAWQATQHDVLSPRETEVYERIRRDPDYEGTTPPREDPPDVMHHQMDRDCGKMHWSYFRSLACFIVRQQDAERAEAATRPATPAPTIVTLPAPRPAATSSTAARPAATAPPTRPTHSPERVHATTQARPPAPAPSVASPAPPLTSTRSAPSPVPPKPPTPLATVRQSPTQPQPAQRQEPPATSRPPPGSAIPPHLRGRILDACATQELRSYRDILAVVRGSARAVIQDAIREMDGSDIALVNGVYRPLQGRVSQS